MLSNKLKQLRNTTHLTQSEFAKKIDVARTTYAMYEQGKREPDYETLKKIASFHGVTTDYLLGSEDLNRNNDDSNDEEFNKWLNDPRSKILFKEFNESSEEQKEALLKMWEFLKSQGKL
ncbi:helix-turn-helix domain-containing protein [Psychrobacillus sp. NPDC096426]|uniref:helix-turn-helix domain-containing protein n=1 Tax=Psychrobacillus sp. NPDC096426 TaxID=3364491 RepID=UPI0037FA795D